MCDVTHSCAWPDSFLCVTWLTRHDVDLFDTSLLPHAQERRMVRSTCTSSLHKPQTQNPHVQHLTHSCMWHISSTYTTWVAHICKYWQHVADVQTFLSLSWICVQTLCVCARAHVCVCVQGVVRMCVLFVYWYVHTSDDDRRRQAPQFRWRTWFWRYLHISVYTYVYTCTYFAVAYIHL